MIPVWTIAISIEENVGNLGNNMRGLVRTFIQYLNVGATSEATLQIYNSL